MRPLRSPLACVFLALASGAPTIVQHRPPEPLLPSSPSRGRLWRRRNRHQWARCAIPRQMTMSPTRLRECIALPGWSQRDLARRLALNDRTARAMSAGKRDIAAELEEWLEAIAARWEALDPDLREGARRMGCDRGVFVRRPLSFRPLTDDEAVQLEALAAFHLARPQPAGWEAAGSAALQVSVVED